MTHLGDNISALIDGELAGADLDKANAHLASCDRCRGEAAALRLLKRELRALVAQASDDDALTSRLLSMGFFPSERAVPGRAADLSGEPDTIRAFPPRPVFRTYHEALDSKPPHSPRRRYLVWGAVSLAVVGGLGAAAFTAGGGAPGTGTGPGVVPQIELYNVEHAIDSGDVPFPDTPVTHATGSATKQATPRKP